MSTTHTTHRATFSSLTTWIGVLILGSALLHSGASAGQAAQPGVSSATTTFSSFDAAQGVFTGGERRDFVTGLSGFGAPSFSAVGSLAMERTLSGNEIRRDEYVGSADSQSVNPGGTSSWTNSGMFFPRHDQTLLLTNSVGLTGDTATWATRVQSLISGSMNNNRIVWDARLADTFEPVYTSHAGGVLVVTDSSGNHPALAFAATTTAGVLVWGGPGGFETPLTNGSRTPSVYVHSVTSMDFTISVVVTLIDHDRCSTSAAADRAAVVAGVIGSASPSLTNCLASSTWSAPAGDITTLGLTLDPLARELSAGQTRVVEVAGLPQGTTAGDIQGSPSTLQFDLDVSDTVEPGSYDLSVLLVTSTLVGGVEHRSEPYSSTAQLTITPLVIPEPEPEPEPDPEPEPEPAVEPEETDTEEVVEDLSLMPEVDENSDEEVQPVVIRQSSGGGSAPAPSPSNPEPLADSVPQAFFIAPEVIEPRLSPTIPPVEAPLEPYQGPTLKPYETPVIQPPTPVAAVTWLGATMMAVLALGSILGMMRRRRN